MARHLPRQWSEFTPYLTMRDAGLGEREAWKQAFLLFAKKLKIRHGSTKRLLFKSPEHTGKIRLILELFPDAKFIHIHRHPHEVFVSTQKMEEKTESIYAFQNWETSEEREKFILWRYREMYSAYIEDSSSLSTHQLVEISYRDLITSPMQTINQIYQQLNIELSESAQAEMSKYIQTVAGYQKNRHPSMSADERDKVNQSWSQYFERWGYSQQTVDDVYSDTENGSW